MPFDKEAYKQFILDNERVTFSPEYFKLASDQKSRFYVNWRKKVNEKLGITSGKNAQITADFLLDFLESKSIEIDTFIGVPESMTMFAGEVQKKHAKRKNLNDYPLIALRKEPKSHGDLADRYFIGEPKGKIAVLEDITTTGDSLITKGIKPIQNAGYEVETALALTNRCPEKEYIEELVKQQTGIDYFSLIHVADLLPEAYKKFTEKLKQDLKQEMSKYKKLEI